MESVVSVVKCQDSHEYQSVEETLKRSLNLLGGLESIICPGDLVIVKPNLIKPAHYHTGIITNSLLIKAICKMSRKARAKRLVIGEGSAVGYDTQIAFEEAGLREIAREVRADLVDFKRTEWTSVPIPKGKIFHRIKLPRILLEANVLINVPVMKTHDVFPATLGLKNLKGVIQEGDKKRFHKWGLAQAIVDLGRVALPELTIEDGTVGMEGLGPTHGEPVNLGVLIASRDTLAADTVAATVMGIDPLEIDYLRLAKEEGLGCAELSEIEIVGDKLDDVIRPFKRVKLDFDAYRQQGIFILEEGACSGCRSTMESLIAGLARGERVDLLKGWTILFGQSVSFPDRLEGRLLNIGTCTRKHKDKGYYIPGCPPHPNDIVSFLEERKEHIS